MVDAASMFMIKDPKRFEVVVTSNLFGDILTDLGAAIAGGMGLAAGANLNPDKTFPSMFEPIHGSAPDIAGQGKANPLATVWSASQMLDFFGYETWGAKLIDIIEEIVGDVRDEYDTEEDAEIKPQLMADGSIVLEARTLLADIVELAGIDVPEDDAADTVGGYICSQLGRIPETHELYRISETMNAVILEADERKIEKIRLEFAGEGKEE